MTTLCPHYDADATKVVLELYQKQLLHLFYCEWYRELQVNLSLALSSFV